LSGGLDVPPAFGDVVVVGQRHHDVEELVVLDTDAASSVSCPQDSVITTAQGVSSKIEREGAPL
jgi:hypothetical protein